MCHFQFIMSFEHVNNDEAIDVCRLQEQQQQKMESWSLFGQFKQK